MAASTSRAPGKKRTTVAKPCAIVPAREGRNPRPSYVADSRLKLRASIPWPRIAQSWSASCSGAWPAHASTTAARIRSWIERSGSRRLLAASTLGAQRVVHARDRPQLGRLLLRGRVVQKIPSSDLRTGEVLEEPRFAQRRMDLDVKVEAGTGRPVGGRVVQHHHIRERHATQVVDPDQGLAHDGREVPE